METPDLRDLSGQFPRNGKVEAIFLRPQRRGEVQPVDQALAIATCRLAGDPYATPSRNRVNDALRCEEGWLRGRAGVFSKS